MWQDKIQDRIYQEEYKSALECGASPVEANSWAVEQAIGEFAESDLDRIESERER